MNDLCKKKRNEMINKIIREEKKNGNIDVKESCFDAELIDISGINFGQIILTHEYFFFISFGEHTSQEEIFRSNDCDMSIKKKQLIYRWDEIEEIIIKRCYGPQIGVELYTIDKKHKTFNLLKMESKEKFQKYLEDKKDKNFELITNPVEAFNKKDFAGFWKDG